MICTLVDEYSDIFYIYTYNRKKSLIFVHKYWIHPDSEVRVEKTRFSIAVLFLLSAFNKPIFSFCSKSVIIYQKRYFFRAQRIHLALQYSIPDLFLYVLYHFQGYKITFSMIYNNDCIKMFVMLTNDILKCRVFKIHY